MERNNELFRYLSMAMPYDVKVQAPDHVSTQPLKIYSLETPYRSSRFLKRGEWYCFFWKRTFANVNDVKPYLRTMESMTEEEKEELKSKCVHTETEEDWEGVRCDVWGIPILDKYDTKRWDNPIWPSTINMDAIDWLLKNHFDFLGLIPKGLAIEVTKEFNPYKK